MATQARLKKRRGAKSAAEVRREAAKAALYMMHSHYLAQARKINQLACAYSVPILSSETIPELADDYAEMIRAEKKCQERWWRSYLLTFFAKNEHQCVTDDEAHEFKKMIDRLIEDVTA